MRFYLELEVLPNVLLQRNILGIAQLRIGLGVAIRIRTDGSRFVALTECRENCFSYWRRDAQRFPREKLVERGAEFLTVHPNLIGRQRTQRSE